MAEIKFAACRPFPGACESPITLNERGTDWTCSNETNVQIPDPYFFGKVCGIMSCRQRLAHPQLGKTHAKHDHEPTIKGRCSFASVMLQRMRSKSTEAQEGSEVWYVQIQAFDFEPSSTQATLTFTPGRKLLTR